MIDTEKLKILRRIGGMAATFFFLALSFWLGGVMKPSSSSCSQKRAIVQQKAKSAQSEEGPFSQDLVEEFLVAYYTKKDLGENRNRYKEFMTDVAYQNEVEREEEPAAQVYKGYVVDSVYQSSEIYLNTKKYTVLAEVSYTSTLLMKQYNYDNASKNMKREAMLQIEYVKKGNDYLISSIKEVGLTNVQTLTPGSAGIEVPGPSHD